MLKPVLMLALVLSITPSFAQAAKCPVINGKFARIVERDGKFYRQTRVQYTRLERGVFSYSIDKENHFQVADGIPRPVKFPDNEGTLSVSCGNSSLVIISMENDATEPYRVEIKPVSETEIKIEETNPAKSGVYTIAI